MPQLYLLYYTWDVPFTGWCTPTLAGVYDAKELAKADQDAIVLRLVKAYGWRIMGSLEWIWEPVTLNQRIVK